MILQFFSELQSANPVLPQYYSSTAPYYKVLLRNTKYYSSTTLYYTVLLQYYSLPKSTTPAAGRPVNTVLAGRPGHMEAAGRPPRDCRPAGRRRNSEQIPGAIVVFHKAHPEWMNWLVHKESTLTTPVHI